MGKNYLDARSVLSAEDFQYATVDCPEWGGPIRVRGLTAGEQSIISKKIQAKDTGDLAVIAMIYGCVDQNGEQIFSNTDKDALRKKANQVVNRIARKIFELSGGDEASIAAAEKNSGKTPDAAS